jgi:hypothetical protein
LKTLTGTGSVDISGASADFGTLNLVTSATYSGSLTLRPSNDGAMDLTGTTAALGTVNGVRTIDYTAVATAAPIITLDAANGTAATVIRTANATTGFGAVSVTQAGTGITDAVTITVANATAANTSGIGAVTAVGVETLTLNLGGTATSQTKAVAGVTMDVTAAPQALTVTSSALATTLGTVTADSINTTGVAGTLTAAFTAGIASAVFTGSTTTASFITGTSNNDLITTGSAADAIYVPANGTGVVNLTGGLGNDTYSLANTTQAGASITDTGGTDTLILAGTASNTATMNNGATFAAIGIDQINTNGTAINTVAPGQIGAQTINAIAAQGTVPVFTLATAGALNVSGVTTTAIAAANLPLSAAGLAVAQTLALTGFTLNGSTGADTITGSALADNITGGGGADVLVGGNGTNTFNFASAANLQAATVTGGTGTDTITITGDAVTLVDTNFTATHTSVETLTLGTGTTATTLGTAANTAGITTINTGTGITTITATAPVTSLAVVSNVADDVALNIGAGATNYTITTLLGNLVVDALQTGNVAVTVSSVATTAVALGTNTTGTKAVTATALTDGQVLTLTGSDAATVSFANGDVTATAYAGALTVTGTGTTGQFTTGTVSSSISSTGTTAIVATALADGQVLSTSGAGVTTITGLIADLTDTSTAAQVITVAAVPNITLALGTDTTGTDAVTANALLDTQVLIMTGSNDVTVALILGDLSAAAYTGAMAITATTGTNIIIGGVGIDVIIGGTGADTINGGGAADSIDVTAAGGDADVVRIGVGDVAAGVVITTADTIAGFAPADDFLDLSGYVLDSLAGAAQAAATFGVDDVATAAVGLDAEAGTDTTVLYTLTMPATTNAFTTQAHIDAAVAAIIAAASAAVFTAVAAAKVLISVVGTDGSDVALFYYSEAGTNGIVATELQLIGVITGAAQLDATALQ